MWKDEVMAAKLKTFTSVNHHRSGNYLNDEATSLKWLWTGCKNTREGVDGSRAHSEVKHQTIHWTVPRAARPAMKPWSEMGRGTLKKQKQCSSHLPTPVKEDYSTHWTRVQMLYVQISNNVRLHGFTFSVSLIVCVMGPSSYMQLMFEVLLWN